jgi:hypothetical protein
VSFVLNDTVPSGRGGVLMLKVYLDRGSRTDAQGVMSVAGALFWPFFYEQFLHVWRPFLDGWNADAFHATDFYPGGGKFKRHTPERKALFNRDSQRLGAELIAPYVKQLFVVAFRADEYQAVAPPEWRARFGSVHKVAAEMMTQSIGRWANSSDHDGDIVYFYENGNGPDDEDFERGLQLTWKNHVSRAYGRMAATPIGVDKGKAHGLEVADLLSWHWNKYDAETRQLRRREPRRDMRALMDALHVKGDQIDVRLFTGSVLREFLIAQGCTQATNA